MLYILYNPSTNEQFITPYENVPENIAKIILLRDLFDIAWPRKRMWNVVGTLSTIRFVANGETDQHRKL